MAQLEIQSEAAPTVEATEAVDALITQYDAPEWLVGYE